MGTDCRNDGKYMALINGWTDRRVNEALIE